MNININKNDKYQEVLSKYNTVVDDKLIKEQVEKIIAEKVAENNTKEIKKFLFSCIDLTSLNTTDTELEMIKLAEKVNVFENEFPDMPNVAAICVFPNMSPLINDNLEAENVKLAAVTGGFPTSQTFIEIKIAETAMTVREGADEIDVVISVGEFLSEDYECMCEEIEEIKEASRDAKLKVILETGALQNASNIKKAAILSIYSGADFIKTSTGKLQPAATPEAAYVMCQTIKEYYQKIGTKIGFKPAGGLNSINDALIYYTIVKEVLGEEWLTKELFRLGTSRLANMLLSDIYNQEINYF